MLAGGLSERLVCPLQDALRAYVYPATRRHLPVHYQALGFEFGEDLSRGPVRHKIRISDEHARRIGRGSEDTYGLAALHKQRLIVLERPEAFHYLEERGPVARRF